LAESECSELVDEEYEDFDENKEWKLFKKLLYYTSNIVIVLLGKNILLSFFHKL
jgi:hypothetical protein